MKYFLIFENIYTQMEEMACIWELYLSNSLKKIIINR